MIMMMKMMMKTVKSHLIDTFHQIHEVKFYKEKF